MEPNCREKDQSHAYALLTPIHGAKVYEIPVALVSSAVATAKVYGIPVALVSSAIATPILFTSSGDGKKRVV